MAIEVAIESPIERPPDEVFASISDLDSWPSWLIASGIVAVRRERAGPPVVGERLTVEQHAAGRAGTFDAEITAVEPGARLALRGRDRDGVTIDIDATVHPVPSTTGPATGLRWEIRIGLPFRYRLFESMARPQVQRAALLDIDGLRRTLESRATD